MIMLINVIYWSKPK